jgi:hypothetical protein
LAHVFELAGDLVVEDEVAGYPYAGGIELVTGVGVVMSMGDSQCAFASAALSSKTVAAFIV